MLRFSALWMLPCVLGAGAVLAAETESASWQAKWKAELEAHRQTREQNLRKPSGWLSLVGLHWLEGERQRIGMAADNDIVLAAGPAHLGIVRREQGQVWLEPAAEAGVRVDGQVLQAPIQLQPDISGQATEILFADGNSGLSLIQRADRQALRVRDANAATRLEFSGLDFYPPDPAWRISARFEPHPEGKTIEIANVINQLEASPNPGVLVFELEGRTHRLEALEGGDDGSLFVIFADRTAGRETYGGGRFLSVPAPVQGRVVLDFNRAYNPPCAFTPYSTCPLPPPENRLNLPVRAGEKKPSAEIVRNAPTAQGEAS